MSERRGGKARKPGRALVIAPAPVDLPPPHGGARARAVILARIEQALVHATPHELSQLAYALAALLRSAAPRHESEEDAPRADRGQGVGDYLFGLNPDDFTQLELAEIRAVVRNITDAARARKAGPAPDPGTITPIEET